MRDAELVAVMEAERKRQKLLVRLDARKMWLHLSGKGHDVARCTIERLYRQQGWVGALRQRRLRALPSDGADRPLDLVDRQFWASRPNQLWVAPLRAKVRSTRSVAIVSGLIGFHFRRPVAPCSPARRISSPTWL